MMRLGRLPLLPSVALSLVACAGITLGGVTNFYYDYLGYNAPSSSLSVLGQQVAHLDAAAAGFNFGSPVDPFCNLNVISDVYQATQAVTIGTGVNGASIVLQPGDLTFAYTIDYTGEDAVVPQNAIKDFQLFRVIVDSVFSTPAVSNPGPFIALENINGAAYNTAAEFNGQSFVAYSAGVTGKNTDYIPTFNVQQSRVQFSWPSDHPVNTGEKAMAFIFCHDVTYMEIGSDDGSTGEGGNVIGTSGAALKNFPVLIPVVPEPASLLTLVLGGTLLCRRRQ